jgi:hypothetical protein
MRTSADIQADLDAAIASRRTTLQAKSYSLDTGQGKQSVERADLGEINKTIRELQAELRQALADESGDTGVTSGSFSRFG